MKNDLEMDICGQEMKSGWCLGDSKNYNIMGGAGEQLRFVVDPATIK